MRNNIIHGQSCKICNTTTNYAFQATILNKYTIEYYVCPTCDFLQTEEPFWLEEAYRNPINVYDTGLLTRNYEFSTIITIIIYFFFDYRKTFLDYGGGYGLLTRTMRDIGFDFFHYDPITPNLFARGFEHNDKNQHYELVTAIECFEHFNNPIHDIEKILSLSRNVFFTTELRPQHLPEQTWWYYGFEHGQHISFYSSKTLSFLAQKYNLYYINLGSCHLLTSKKLNPLLIRVLISFRHKGLFISIKKIMNSKTLSDYEYLKKSTVPFL
ncbi:MAG: class I SAM-dependent methyltransferase [Bacteroidetes bacterium]|nr:class I SAM-dependent methyltransferase [Bacteroidota bacterium]